MARTIVKYDRIVDSGYSKSIQCQVSDTIRRIVRIQNSPIIIPIFMITFMTHWSRETSLLIEGPPFFLIAAAIIDHAANIGQISSKPHPKTHF